MRPTGEGHCKTGTVGGQKSPVSKYVEQVNATSKQYPYLSSTVCACVVDWSVPWHPAVSSAAIIDPTMSSRFWLARLRFIMVVSFSSMQCGGADGVQ
jgi:hypothetical protein